MAMYKWRGNRFLILKGVSGNVLEECVGLTRSIAVAIFGKYNIPKSPKGEKSGSYLLPGKEMKKLG